MGVRDGILSAPGIYCIECLANGKRYIGQSIDVSRRFVEHRNTLRHDRNQNEALQADWNTYGESNFNLCVLEYCEKELLDEKEQYYIGLHKSDSAEFGYNIEPGGYHNKTMCEQTKQKISKAETGRKLSEETKQKISAANKGRVFTGEALEHIRNRKMPDMSGANNPMYGKHHSEETKRKMLENRHVRSGSEHPNYGKPLPEETRRKLSEAHMGKMTGADHPNHRPIYCPEFDEYFWGPKEVQNKYGIRAADISTCLNGRQKSAGKHPITGEKLHWLDAKADTSNIQN